MLRVLTTDQIHAAQSGTIAAAAAVSVARGASASTGMRSRLAIAIGMIASHVSMQRTLYFQ